MAYVYVFQSGGENLFKIGRTRGDVEKRRKDLSTGNPHPLTTFRLIETDHDSLFENFLHKKFAGRLSRRSDAREFYELIPAELEQGLREAEEFMAGYIPLLDESEKLKDLESSGEVISPDQESLEIYRELREVIDRANILDFEKTILVNKLKSRIGAADGIVGGRQLEDPDFLALRSRPTERGRTGDLSALPGRNQATNLSPPVIRKS